MDGTALIIINTLFPAAGAICLFTALRLRAQTPAPAPAPAPAPQAAPEPWS